MGLTAPRIQPLPKIVLVGIFAIYTIICLTILILGYRIDIPQQYRGSTIGRLFNMASIFRIMGNILGIAVGLFVSTALVIERGGKGFLFVFLLCIPAFLFQGVGAIIDGICSHNYSAGTSTPHSLMGAAALGIFACFISLGSAIFLGMHRFSLAGYTGGPAQSLPDRPFEPLFEDSDGDQDALEDDDQTDDSDALEDDD